MSNETIIFFIAIVLVVGSLPTWPHSKSWGYAPTGILSLLLVVFLIWAIAGERPLFGRSAGDDIRSAGRNAADSIRDAVK